MPAPITLELGGISIQLKPDKKSGDFYFVKKTADFIKQSDPEITLNIHCGTSPNTSDQDVVFETNIGWFLGKLNGKSVINVRAEKAHQVGIFPEDFSSGDIFVGLKDEGEEQYIFPLAYPMGEIFLMNKLGSGMGVLMHAAGVIYNGQGFLFAGQGGAGKTTCAQIWQEYKSAQVINDDKVIIRKKDEAFHIFGTPWHGEGGMALPLDAPLKGLFILRQAQKNEFKSIPPLDMVLKLMDRSFLPLWDKGKMDFTLAFFHQLLQAVPCREFGFLPNGSIADFVLSSFSH